METPTDFESLRVSFVIPAMNEASMIVRALESIRRLNHNRSVMVQEVIVVDSGSRDATPDLARAAGCRVLPAQPGNVSASRNLGAAAATGNLLAFLDADCELPENWLLQLAEQLQDPQVVACGMTMAAAGEQQPWVERVWYQLAHRRSVSGESADADWLATFNLAVRTESFTRVGGFDEQLLTCEDVDLGYRLQQHGRLRTVSGCGVVHHGESKTLAEFFRRESWRARGGWRLLQQHGGSVRELVSCAIPFVVTAGWGLGALLATVLLLAGQPLPAVGVVLGGLLPLLLMTARSRPNLVHWPAALLLLAVYYVARCRGMLKSAGRVERSENSPEPTVPQPKSREVEVLS